MNMVCDLFSNATDFRKERRRLSVAFVAGHASWCCRAGPNDNGGPWRSAPRLLSRAGVYSGRGSADHQDRNHPTRRHHGCLVLTGWNGGSAHRAAPAGSRRGCGFFAATSRIAKNGAQVTQKCCSFGGALDDDAATIQRVHLAPSVIEFRQPIERACDGGLRNVKIGGEATDRMSAFLEVAGQENAELPSGKIHAVTPYQGDNGIAQDTDQLIWCRG